MREDDVQGPLSLLAILIVGIMDAFSASRVRGAEGRARRQAARAEHRARIQRQQWYDLTQRQMSRGSAGDASPDDARAALRGVGGRASRHDDEFF